RNELKPNGLAKNGLKPNGVPKNRFATNGLLNNGEKPNWLVKIWSSRNGLMPPRWNGVVPNGLPVNGLEANCLLRETDIDRPAADWFCGICRTMIMDRFWGIGRFIMDGFRDNCPTIMPCRIRA